MGFALRVIIAVFAIVLIRPVAASADFLSDDDVHTAKAAFKAATQDRWRKGARLAAKAENPLLLKTYKWFEYSRLGGAKSFAEIAAFIAENPTWPDQNLLARRAEEAMKDSLAPETALAWFQDHPPLSTSGRIQHIRALLALGRKDEARAEIRDTWTNNNFAKRPEKIFYQRYRKYLSAEDNLKRLDRLLWEGRNWPARRMIWKVKSGQRAVAEARLMLRHRLGNVDKAIARIAPELQNDPGLVYERLRWRRSKGHYESAVELLSPAPDNLVRADLWWKERAYLARLALQKGHISDAYRIVADNRLDQGANFADAEWMAGWISLRFLNDPKAALSHFMSLYEGVKYPVSRARGAYWAARAAEALDDQETAEEWYRTAAALPTAYYGQLAASRLGPGHGLRLPQGISAQPDEADAFARHELHQVMELLYQVDEGDRLKPFALALANSDASPSWRKMTAELAHALGRPDLGISIAKQSSRDGIEFIDAGYPIIAPPPLRARSPDYKLEKPLVLAMIRQESAFSTTAKSHANAQGLMQLMPATAKRVARQLHIPYSKKRLTGDPQYNMLLGQAYVAGLIDEFEGSYVLSLAAYNAGPARARKWSRMNGTPGDTGVDNVDWIEMIPITETRNYVQRVLENLQIYRLRLSETEVAETLDGDLSR